LAAAIEKKGEEEGGGMNSGEEKLSFEIGARRRQCENFFFSQPSQLGGKWTQKTSGVVTMKSGPDGGNE
jgi:hypothetical protein